MEKEHTRKTGKWRRAWETRWAAATGCTTPIAGTFLVAVPHWGVEVWEVDEYVLQANFASKLPENLPMCFYHSRDDGLVPFGHLALYAEKLPQARFREFDGRGHQFDDDLSEVAHDMEGLEVSES